MKQKTITILCVCSVLFLSTEIYGMRKYIIPFTVGFGSAGVVWTLNKLLRGNNSDSLELNILQRIDASIQTDLISDRKDVSIKTKNVLIQTGLISDSKDSGTFTMTEKEKYFNFAKKLLEDKGNYKKKFEESKKSLKEALSKQEMYKKKYKKYKKKLNVLGKQVDEKEEFLDHDLDQFINKNLESQKSEVGANSTSDTPEIDGLEKLI